MSDLGWLFNAGVMRLLANGLAVTVLLAVICGALSFIIGNLLALARMSQLAVVRYPAVIYIEVIRALPLLLFIFAVYFLSKPVFGINLEPFPAAVIALSGFTGAVTAEIMRAGFLSVEAGLIQAATAQGFSDLQIFLQIRFPLALRRMVPALVTQMTSLLKATSLVVVIGVPEFFERAVLLTTRPPFQPVPVYLLVAIVYFLMNYGLSVLSKRLERMEAGGLKHA
ncbi:amino acid ABC transporter permease [Reyranella sp.]|uniref:amino acid ABC transporter permease n=1 Tax=Reyranella sp. TaxID=1929291 RepID=UPI003784A4A1